MTLQINNSCPRCQGTVVPEVEGYLDNEAFCIVCGWRGTRLPTEYEANRKQVDAMRQLGAHRRYENRTAKRKKEKDS